MDNIFVLVIDVAIACLCCIEPPSVNSCLLIQVMAITEGELDDGDVAGDCG